MRKTALLLFLSLSLILLLNCGDDDSPTGTNKGGALTGSWSWLEFSGITRSGSYCFEEGISFQGFILNVAHTGNTVTISDSSGSVQGTLNGNQLTFSHSYDDGNYSKTETYNLTVTSDYDSMVGSSSWVYGEVGQGTCSGTSYVIMMKNLQGNCATLDGVWVMDQPACLNSMCTYELSTMTIRPVQTYCVFGGYADTDQSHTDFWGKIEGNTIQFTFTYMVSLGYTIENLILVFDLEMKSPSRLEGTVTVHGSSSYEYPVVFLKQ